jgi:hypothetical protein
MRRILVVAVVAAGAMMAGDSSVSAGGQHLYDCAYFGYQEDAQAVYDRNPDDPYQLDQNGNGIACEGLPSRPTDGSNADDPDGDDRYDCDDFTYQEDAQAVYEIDTFDPYHLDANNDGIACNDLPSRDTDDGHDGDDDGNDEGDDGGNTGGTGGTTTGEDVYDCPDFQFQEDAQAEHDRDPSDPSGLDGPIGPNNDTTGTPGKACEDLPLRDGSETVSTMPTTGAGSTQSRHTAGMLTMLVLLTIAVGVGGVSIRRTDAGR